MELYEATTYKSNIPFLFNVSIREYDISKANINILLWKNKIDKETYDYLYSSPRDVRQYIVGNMQKNESINQALMDGFQECRKMFLDSNGLNEMDILSIRKDAIFVINKIPSITQFDNIVFIPKNMYTSYISLNKKNIELYYSPPSIGNNNHIDVKGISEMNLKKHEEYFLDFLYFLFEIVETESTRTVIRDFKNFFDQYVNKELDIGYYRTFDYLSSFIIQNNKNLRKDLLYMIDSRYIAKQHMDDINISYNMNLLREIFMYISSLTRL